MKLQGVIRAISLAVVASTNHWNWFIVDERGLVLTNQHVIDAIEKIPALPVL